jgi:hypothetical protein
MTSGKTRLDHFDEFMINEILATSDEDIIAEVGEQAIDSAIAGIEAAKLDAGKTAFTTAKSQMVADRQHQIVVPMDRAKARANLSSLMKSDQSFASKLTLAARNAASGQNNDDEGLLDDLEELLGADVQSDKP